MADTRDHQMALTPGTELDEYRIERELGHGSFGITYLARDINLGQLVAIKEYLPRDVAYRADTAEVRVISQAETQDFEWGMKRFLDEARILASFRHPGIVGVRRFFKANGTAYIVMEYYEGVTLDKIVAEGATVSADRLRSWLNVLLGALKRIHDQGVIHRDIKPGNIFVRKGVDTPVLLDFGAARQSLESQGRSVTAMVSPGYGAFEQYSSRGDLGPWTDIYGLAATLYRCVVGRAPPEAAGRVEEDTLEPAARVAAGRYPAALLEGIDHGLAVLKRDRPADVTEWREELKPFLERTTGKPEATGSAETQRASSGEQSQPATAKAGEVKQGDSTSGSGAGDSATSPGESQTAARDPLDGGIERLRVPGAAKLRGPGQQQANARGGALSWVWASLVVVAIALGGGGVLGYFLYGPTFGEQLWRFETGSVVESSPAIGADGTVYVGSHDNHVYALNAAGPEVRWRLQTGGWVVSSPAIGADGTVYVGSDDGHVYALDPDPGSGERMLWRFEVGRRARSTPAVGPDGTVYVSSDDHYVYALDPDPEASERVLWRFETGDDVRSSPAVGPDGTVYVGSDDGHVYALSPDPAAGERVLWRFETGDRVRSSPAIGPEGTVYVGSDDHHVYALDPDPAVVERLLWRFETGAAVRAGPAADADGTVYVGSQNGYVYALDRNPLASERLLWRFATGAAVPAAPTIGPDGNVYVGSLDYNLYALDADPGAGERELWRFETGGVVKSSPALGPEGTVYVGSGDRHVYALGPPDDQWSGVFGRVLSFVGLGQGESS